MRKFILYVVLILSLFTLSDTVRCQSTPYHPSAEIAALRDSLDAVQYFIPPMPQLCKVKIITICNQAKWDSLENLLRDALEKGQRNIEIQVTGKDIEFGKIKNEIINWDYPNANIIIDGSKAKMIPYGYTFKKNDRKAQKVGGFYSFPYNQFAIDDVYTDNKGNEVMIREDVQQIDGDIVKVNGDVWRFRMDLPDLSEEKCKDFYVLLTRDWTSVRHKVVKVEDGWLYYHLDSEDLHSERNPNVDWIQYHVRPRYRLINNPVSNGLHIVDGRIYIPNHFKSVRVNKGGQIITFAYCHFNTLEIKGFKLNGCGNTYASIGIFSSIFGNGAFITNNIFTNMSSMSISSALSSNVVIADNFIEKTRQQAIEGGGFRTTITKNHLRNIGWMLNTRAITGGGEYLHICDNIIEDFNYAAIACGSTESNKNATRLTYVIERNIVRLNKEYTDNYIRNTLADGGGIYTGPQCTYGIIRNNVVENMRGIHSNRGIFLDDGAKNLAIYGNLIKDTYNSYDIDLRLTNVYSSDIPDHNTHNCIFQNIMTGGYRFQEKVDNRNCIVGGNLLTCSGRTQETVVDIKLKYSDKRLNNKGQMDEELINKLSVDRFVRVKL